MSLGKTATGQVVNLLSNDVSRYDLAFIFLHSFWIGPIVIILIVYYLWLDIGVSCLAGLIPNIFLTLPLQGKLCNNLGVCMPFVTVTRSIVLSVENRIGPQFAPCGTPKSAKLVFEVHSLICHKWYHAYIRIRDLTKKKLYLRDKLFVLSNLNSLYQGLELIQRFEEFF